MVNAKYNPNKKIPAWTWKLHEMELESLKQKIDWLKAYLGDWKPEKKT